MDHVRASHHGINQRLLVFEVSLDPLDVPFQILLDHIPLLQVSTGSSHLELGALLQEHLSNMAAEVSCDSCY
jgi:hypothetical protein